MCCPHYANHFMTFVNNVLFKSFFKQKNQNISEDRKVAASSCKDWLLLKKSNLTVNFTSLDLDCRSYKTKALQTENRKL